jgi:hypothetical protein
MASELIDVTGVARYPKLTEATRDQGSTKGENGAKYDYAPATTVDLVLDQEELVKVTRANPGVKPGVTEDGLVVKFRRTWDNSVNPAWGGAPTIKDGDGNLWNTEKLIGNGSKLRIAAEVYDTKFGKGMRMLGVQVLEHVEPDFAAAPELPF